MWRRVLPTGHLKSIHIKGAVASGQNSLAVALFCDFFYKSKWLSALLGAFWCINPGGYVTEQENMVFPSLQLLYSIVQYPARLFFERNLRDEV